MSTDAGVTPMSVKMLRQISPCVTAWGFGKTSVGIPTAPLDQAKLTCAQQGSGNVETVTAWSAIPKVVP